MNKIIAIILIMTTLGCTNKQALTNAQLGRLCFKICETKNCTEFSWKGFDEYSQCIISRHGKAIDFLTIGELLQIKRSLRDELL